jgi:hypothetical protein
VVSISRSRRAGGGSATCSCSSRRRRFGDSPIYGREASTSTRAQAGDEALTRPPAMRREPGLATSARGPGSGPGSRSLPRPPWGGKTPVECKAGSVPRESVTTTTKPANSAPRLLRTRRAPTASLHVGRVAGSSHELSLFSVEVLILAMSCIAAAARPTDVTGASWRDFFPGVDQPERGGTRAAEPAHAGRRPYRRSSPAAAGRRRPGSASRRAPLRCGAGSRG